MASAAEVARWCGITYDNVVKATSERDPSPPASDSIAELDRISANLAWRSVDQLKIYCDPDVVYILGLDQENNRDRLRAMVVRAFASAERVADCYADYLVAMREADRLASVFERILSQLKHGHTSLWKRSREPWAWRKHGPVARGLAVLGRWRYESRDVTEDRSTTVSEGLALFDEMVDQMRGLASGIPARGRTKEIPRLFLVLRLAEVFALSTGIAPTFHFSEKGSRREKNEPTPWHHFLVSVFRLIGYPITSRGLDHVLREIGSMDVHRWGITDFAEWARRLKERWQSEHHLPRRVIVRGDFQSVGIEIYYCSPRGGVEDDDVFCA